MSSCVFTAWFTVTGFHFSIWANLYMNIGHVDLTSAIEEIDCNAVIMCFSPWNLCIVWMTAPAHGGGEGHLCRDSGVLLMTLCRRRRLRGVVKAAGECVAAFCGWGLAESVQSISRPKPGPLSLVLIYLTLLTPHYCRFPSLKMMCIWCLWSHFLLSLFSVT